MIRIKVYGPGCARCRQTETLIRRVVQETGVDAEVEKVSDIEMLASAGVLSTPGVSVDGVIKLAGRIPRMEEIRGWLLGASTGRSGAPEQRS